MRFVDADRLDRARFLAARSPRPRRGCDVVLVHAGATELCRLFAQRRAAAPRRCRARSSRRRPPGERDPRLRVDEAARAARRPDGRHDLLLGAAPHSPRAERIAAQLAGCADNFLGAVLRDWARVDPAGDADATPPSAGAAPLRRRSASSSRRRRPGRLRRDVDAPAPRTAPTAFCIDDSRSRPCTPPKASWT